MMRYDRAESPFSLTPWVKGIIIANAVVFLLQKTVFTGPWFYELFAFSPGQAGRHWWGFVSYMFVHGGLLHLAFNMLMLFFFGPAVERRMGSTGFAVYYFVCGLGGAIFSFAVSLFTPVMPFVGASAAVFGVSLAFAMNWPDAGIYVFPLPFPVKAKWLVIFLAAVNLLAAVTSARDGVAHLAHLGGFLFGFLYLRAQTRVAQRSRVHTRRAPRLARIPERKGRAHAPAARDEHPAPSDIQAQVDRLLDKISESGLESLTPAERRLLNDMSRQLREH